MVNQEPVINVGILEEYAEASGSFNGKFRVDGVIDVQGNFCVRVDQGRIVLTDGGTKEILRAGEIVCRPLEGGTFLLRNVAIGVKFHWERKEDQVFEGALRLLASENATITAINEISVEAYLKSVISSEMSAESPPELLKAHAITSRSWLVAMLEKQKRAKNIGDSSQRWQQTTQEVVRWYDREDHALFDVCADDHCQRYQGVSKILSDAARQAVDTTRGLFLVYAQEICDARYSKACGGLSESFENVWEETSVPYLTCVSDAPVSHSPIQNESDARKWILSRPDAYCNTTDRNILRQILPSFDQETTDFFRWRVEYPREELEEILRSKSGIDFGTLRNLVPVLRGSSGRMIKLKIEGSKRTLNVGKDLEIRRWLSKSHLYSSAFVVDVERDHSGIPKKFALHGAGWGHGVGLCQIGAAMMAAKGKKAEEIVKHYFRGAELQKLY